MESRSSQPAIPAARTLHGGVVEPEAIAITESETYEKAGEIDDSSGSFGDFVGQLHCGWIKARQAAGADAGETATRLLAWMEADPYGFCHDLERNAAKVLTKTGLAALIKEVRERFDKAGTIKPTPAGSFHRDAAYARRRWRAALRTLYAAQKSVDAYLALTQETGLTAADCVALATMLVARPEDRRRVDVGGTRDQARQAGAAHFDGGV
ncbi:MAG TPA: hypothetical protein VGJ39_15405 [Vicinamibacterales bacterium]|jgi:hypothetical protein